MTRPGRRVWCASPRRLPHGGVPPLCSRRWRGRTLPARGRRSPSWDGMAIPASERRAPGAAAGSGATDITSVYGYAGPLAWGCMPWDPFVRRAWAELLEVWRQQGAVSVFTRFHPLLGNASLVVGLQAAPDDRRGHAGLAEGGPTVSIDLTKGADAARDGYRRDMPRRIGLAREKALVTENNVEWEGARGFRPYLQGDHGPKRSHGLLLLRPV